MYCYIAVYTNCVYIEMALYIHTHTYTYNQAEMYSDTFNISHIITVYLL